MKEYINKYLSDLIFWIDQPRKIGGAVAKLIFGLDYFTKYFLPMFTGNNEKNKQSKSKDLPPVPKWQKNLLTCMFFNSLLTV